VVRGQTAQRNVEPGIDKGQHPGVRARAARGKAGRVAQAALGQDAEHVAQGFVGLRHERAGELVGRHLRIVRTAEHAHGALAAACLGHPEEYACCAHARRTAKDDAELAKARHAVIHAPLGDDADEKRIDGRGRAGRPRRPAQEQDGQQARAT
jgi:hypothetical protein